MKHLTQDEYMCINDLVVLLIRLGVLDAKKDSVTMIYLELCRIFGIIEGLYE